VTAAYVALELVATFLLSWAVALSVPGLSWRAVRDALDEFTRKEVI
jgi:hypothetical protein